MRRNDEQSVITRREALIAAAGLGAGIAFRAGSAGAKEQATQPGDTKVCVLTPEAMEGPFYFDPKLVRTDITEGKQGAPLSLTLQIVEAKDCAAIPAARVDVWHADGLGLYSGYARQETGSAKGETFLRGTQSTGAGGEVSFTTIYPGCIQAARLMSTSRCLSASATWSPASCTFPMPSQIVCTRRLHPTASGRPREIHSMLMTLFS